jgi:3-oxoacyl-[acyl-carrier protein] reductase
MNERNELEGKLAVVTGGSRGLGTFVTRELAEAGARVVFTGRHDETLSRAAGRLGERVSTEVCDHADAGSIESFAARLLRGFGVPDILVNNAGVVPGPSPVVDLDPSDWDRVIRTNLTGVYLTTRAFLPGMYERESGEIVMISSTSGKRADPGSAAYNASKFGLNGFAEALTKEARKKNVRVHVVCPSRIDMTDPPGAERGKGIYLHAADVARTVRHLVSLPGRTLIRELEIWGTNP